MHARGFSMGNRIYRMRVCRLCNKKVLYAVCLFCFSMNKMGICRTGREKVRLDVL